MLGTNNRACRNCSSNHIITTQNAIIAPFFMKRVFSTHINSLGETIQQKLNPANTWKKKAALLAYRTIQQTNILRGPLNLRSSAITSIRVCIDCGFIGPDLSFPSEMLCGLYRDYRHDTYNNDRCSYEPDYLKIQHLVGKNDLEIEGRLNNVDAFLKTHIDLSKINNVLDWGGGEGRFIPSDLIKKQIDILDVSNEPLINTRYRRVSEPKEKYDYIQLCHVLEHVSEPLSLIRHISSFSGKRGIIYIEVPQDRSDGEIDEFKKGTEKLTHIIHEHINLYSKSSIRALGKTAGLKEISIKDSIINTGWCRAPIISGLFQSI